MGDRKKGGRGWSFAKVARGTGVDILKNTSGDIEDGHFLKVGKSKRFHLYCSKGLLGGGRASEVRQGDAPGLFYK